MTSDTASQIAYLARALKAPALRDSAERLAERARADGWTHQEYLAACLDAEVATRSAHGAANRTRAAGFPARKTIEDFDFDHQRSVKRDHVEGLRCGVGCGGLVPGPTDSRQRSPGHADSAADPGRTGRNAGQRHRAGPRRQ